jgi:hypothetical protein
MMPAAPPKPAFLNAQDDPARLLTPMRRRLRDAYIGMTDRGWLGLTPLEAHVVICGYPRSGTTLLQAMLEASAADALAFGRERGGLGVARYTWPGRYRFLLSKKPNDIFWVDEIRDYYRGRQTRIRFVLSLRDPRAVLTSIFVDKPGYCVPPEKWRAVYEHIEHQRRHEDVMLVEYRDLVERPTDVQARLTTFTGCEIRQRFDDFHASVPKGFDTRALNGVRPLDRTSLDKWRSPRHRARLQQVLRELPELPERLIELGYESDTEWVREYR